ncbi:MAG: TRAP transporter substrate-binding protein DctP [Rhodocyclaceae bacterium]|nr:TRAP transporter substrate-binding protein DctP [Rhodocyclaceae bacterium]
MERRKFIKHAGLAGILAAGVAPAAYAQGANIRWRLASSFPKALDTIFGAADVFSKKLKEMSGGKFEISVHAGGELMPPFGVVDGVQQGTVECAHTAPYYFYGKDPTFSLNCAIPFGLNSRQMTAWMYEGNGPMGNTGAQMGGWFRKPIKSVKDMKGLKMRISNLAGEVAARLGVVPQSLPGGELYQALEKGTIDAVEWVGPYDDQKLGFYKVAKNYVYPAWWEGGPELELYVNSKAWESLSPEYKAMLECAAATAHTDMLAKYDAKNPRALKELVASGVKLQRMPKDAMDAAWKAAQEVYADLSAKNANWKKIYDDQIAFRREQNQWFRFAEMGFDSYMQSLKL